MLHISLCSRKKWLNWVRSETKVADVSRPVAMYQWRFLGHNVRQADSHWNTKIILVRQNRSRWTTQIGRWQNINGEISVEKTDDRGCTVGEARGNLQLHTVKDYMWWRRLKNNVFFNCHLLGCGNLQYYNWMLMWPISVKKLLNPLKHKNTFTPHTLKTLTT